MLHFSCGSSTVSLISIKVLVLVILAIMPKEKKNLDAILSRLFISVFPSVF